MLPPVCTSADAAETSRAARASPFCRVSAPSTSRPHAREPVEFEAAPEVPSRAVEHDPEIVHGDSQNFTNLFAPHPLHLAQRESARDALRERPEAVAEDLPELALLQQLRRAGAPLDGRAGFVEVALPLARLLE